MRGTDRESVDGLGYTALLGMMRREGKGVNRPSLQYWKTLWGDWGRANTVI